MTISQRIEQRQAQTLIMTPQLQQAIKLLQMSNMELTDFIEKEIETNPLLERADGGGDLSAPSVGDEDASSVEFTDSGDGNSSKDVEEGVDVINDDQESWSSDGYADEDRYSTNGPGGGNDSDFSAAQNVAEKPSLRSHLLEQINIDFTDPADRIVASALIEMLDEAGYLPSELELVRAQLGATPERFSQIISRLQRFDPCGIFARSLRECLALQLADKNRLDPAMDLLLDNLDLLAKRETGALMKICRVDAEDLALMISEIKCLNPKPASAFVSDVAPPIVPDVILRRLPGGGWHVELNTETLPRVLANERYYSQIQASSPSKADKDYIVDRWQQANWLVKALHQRATTILKVAGEIVRQQDQFFVHGIHHMKPLVLKDIAQLVEMHESTISRVTQNKYIATPRGMFELKFFFTTALARSDGGEDVSSEAVRARIRTLIDSEKPKAILSDDKLSMILRGEGVDIARRTVAKYREAMHIPTSAQRRREKRG